MLFLKQPTDVTKLRLDFRYIYIVYMSMVSRFSFQSFHYFPKSFQNVFCNI